MVPISNETLAHEQEARITRAVEQGGEMVWTTTKTGWTVKTPSGGNYQVAAGWCSCPDYTYRGSRNGIPCKHLVALGIRRLEQGEF